MTCTERRPGDKQRTKQPGETATATPGANRAKTIRLCIILKHISKNNKKKEQQKKQIFNRKIDTSM